LNAESQRILFLLTKEAKENTAIHI